MKNQLNIVLENACKVGLAEGVYTGVSAAVSMLKKGKRLRAVYGGGVIRSGCDVPVRPSTLFDLASLTKPLCTTLCTLHCIDSGNLDWNSKPLSLVYDSISNDQKEITIKNILHHSSGLLDYRNFFINFKPEYNKLNLNLLIEKIVKEPLVYKTGEKSLYSDLGFILLGIVLEKIHKITLEVIFQKKIFEPIRKIQDVLFLPTSHPCALDKNDIAATEYCTWRNKVLHGEAHDEHCWLMGGVAGHAGLFGSALGVLEICERLLDCWHDTAAHPAFTNATLYYALTKKGPGGKRLLGFDIPSEGISSSGRFFSEQSAGHLGFTGTSFWIDLKQRIIVVLLTNRVHPTRENVKIKTFRPYFHDMILEGIVQ